MVLAEQASARAYPSARESNVLQMPRDDVIPAAANVAETPGVSTRKTAATKAALHREEKRASRLARAATRADEHAVSNEAHGPCNPSAYERRPEAIDTDEPVAAYALLAMGDAARTWAKADPEKATKTPTSVPAMLSRPKLALCRAA